MELSHLKFNFVILSNCYFNTLCKDWRRIVVVLESLKPELALVNVGNSITLHCGSRMAVTWTFSSDVIPIYQESSSTLPDLTLNNLEEQNSGSYTCQGTNFMAKSLLVVAPLDSHYYTVIPTWTETTEGNSVTLTCSSMKGIEWFGVHLHNINKSLNGNTLTLHNLQRKHSGNYYCRNVNYDKEIRHSKARIIVDSYVELVVPVGSI